MMLTDPTSLSGFAFSTDVSGLKYWDLHIFLLLPTLWLLTVGKPQMLLSGGGGSSNSDGSAVTPADAYGELKQTAAYSFIAFILAISVAQAFIWDSVGAEIGIWMFNPLKCTGVEGVDTLLPVEEVAWLFHHVMKAALWQLKVAELPWTEPDSDEPSPLPTYLRDLGNVMLGAVAIGGVTALLGDADSAKCVGLVAAFFAPVFLIVYNLGRRYFRSHWKLFLIGWLPPGLWTVAIDALGQQQEVWYFPPRYLTGINDPFGGWLKLDIAAVYMVSTLAVTATGAIIFAAAEEFSRRKSALTAEVEPGDGAAAVVAKPNLWDLGLFIFDGAFPGAAKWPQRTYLDSYAGAARAEREAAEAAEEERRKKAAEAQRREIV